MATVPAKYPQPIDDRQLEQFRKMIEDATIDDALRHRLELKAKAMQLEQIVDVADEVLLARIPAELGELSHKLKGEGSARSATKWTHTIKKEKLILKNVDPDVIAECTDSTESAPFLVVEFPRAKKAGKDDDAAEDN